MSKTLDEIRKKLQAMDTRKGGQQGGYSNDKLTYAHWNIAEGTQSILRLLPDGNTDNTFFWVERQMIKLTFPGIKGHDENKAIEIQVPCIEMWDGKNTCPILNEVRPMWKDKSLEDIARKYWIKKTYFAQGFVKKDGMNESDPPENPIRKFIIGAQIFKIFQAALMDVDMENSPVDYINGTDFIVEKTSKGGYADYGTSKWARKESSLTPEQLTALDQYGLADLSSYLPKRPTEEQMVAMFEMFQASLDGELYDPVRWAKYYKPYGFDTGSSDTEDSTTTPKTMKPVVTPRTPVVSTPKTVAVEQPSVEDDEVKPVRELVGESATPAKTPQEILAMLRQRKTT